MERTEHAQDTRDRSRYDVSRANSPVRGFSLTILDKGALEQGILSIPIEDPVRPRRHWRGQMLACPAPRCALTHTLSLFLSLALSFLFIRLAFTTGPRRVCAAVERRRRSLVLLPSRSLLVNPRVSTRSRAALCSLVSTIVLPAGQASVIYPFSRVFERSKGRTGRWTESVHESSFGNRE